MGKRQSAGPTPPLGVIDSLGHGLQAVVTHLPLLILPLLLDLFLWLGPQLSIAPLLSQALAFVRANPEFASALNQQLPDPDALPAACVRQRDSGQWSIAALNLQHAARAVAVQLPRAAAGVTLHVLTYSYGDLYFGKVGACVLPQPAPGAAGQLTVGADGVLSTTLPALTLAVFTEFL